MNLSSDAAEHTVQRFTDSTSHTVAAVLVSNADLVHTTQIFPATETGDSADAQMRSVLERLDGVLRHFDSDRAAVVKLNVYLLTADLRESFLRELVNQYGEDSLPAVSFVTTPLPSSGAMVAIDAVFARGAAAESNEPQHHHLAALGGHERQSHAAVLPRCDVIYIAGQAEPGELAEATRETLSGLMRTLEHLGLGGKHIVSLKCFVQPMSDIGIVEEELSSFFAEGLIPPVSHVEWISSPQQPIEIELIAWAPAQAAEVTVTYTALPWLPTSPVYSRVARIHGDRRLYVSGLMADQAGNGEQQVRSIFSQLERVLAKAGSDLQHLAKATYYVSDEDVSGQLNQLRPDYYDPNRPPAASKAMVRGVGHPARTITIDMIAAPHR